jgi:hypothetical protein
LANVSTANLTTDATTITTLHPSLPSLITVRIYIEGWDAQTSNSLLAALISVSFEFRLKNSSL